MSLFLVIIIQKYFHFYDGLQSDDDIQKPELDELIKEFEEFFIGETHEAYESYQFHLRMQEQFKNIETYTAVLRQLAKNCNFGQSKDRQKQSRDMQRLSRKHYQSYSAVKSLQISWKDYQSSWEKQIISLYYNC